MKTLYTRLILFSAVVLLSAAGASAQITFQREYGGGDNERGDCVQQTTDGGYIMVGETWSYGINAAVASNIYLVKTNALGDTLWTRVFGQLGDDFGRYVQQTSDGGYIITGVTDNDSINKGKQDVYLIKTNANGDSIWTKVFGGTLPEAGNYVEQTSDGGYFIAGSTDEAGSGLSDVYLIKTNSLGDTLWTRTYGGSANDFGASGQQTSDGGYIITGFTGSFGAGNGDIYLIKTNSLGDSLWTKAYGGINADGAGFVRQTSDKGYIIVGATQSFGTGVNDDAYLIKTDSLGNVLWSKTYGDAFAYQEPACVKETSDGGFVVTGVKFFFGAVDEDAFLFKTDANGNLLWAKSYGTSSVEIEFGQSVQQTTDGGFIMLGMTIRYATGSGVGEFYLIKTDSSGNMGCTNNTCNDSILSLITTVAATITTLPPTQVNAGTIIKSSATVVQRGGTVNTLCSPLPLSITATGTAICSGSCDTVLAKSCGGVFPFTYSWSPGSQTTSSIIVCPSATTIFTVTITDGANNSVSDTCVVTVYPSPVAQVSNNDSICNGGSVQLSASGGATYSWMPSAGLSSTSISNPLASPTLTTTYTVTVSTGPCWDTATVTVIVFPLPFVNAGIDITLAFGQSILLNPSSNATNFNWSPSSGLSCSACPNPLANPVTTTTYTVLVTDNNGCTATDEITISVECEDIYVPNVFSPNGDGKNDVLYVRSNCIRSMVFSIFDRWGEKVFESDDLNRGWDGIYLNTNAPTGVYVYSLWVTMADGTEKLLKGNISLLR